MKCRQSSILIVWVFTFVASQAIAVEHEKSAMCDSAVDQARYVLNMMRSTVERNRDNGFLSDSEYVQATESLDRMDPLLTQGKCMASSGVDLEIYECLSSNRGNLLGCTMESSSS